MVETTLCVNYIMVAVRVVVVHLVVDDVLDGLEGAAAGDRIPDLVLQVAEEALLRSIIPAVALAGHGLQEICVFQLLDKGKAGVVAALVGVDDRFVVQLAAVVPDQGIHGVQDEGDFQRRAEPVCQDFPGQSIQDRGQVALSALVEQVSDVGQQHLSGTKPMEISCDSVGRYSVGTKRLCHLPVWIFFPNRTFQTVFLH